MAFRRALTVLTTAILIAGCVGYMPHGSIGEKGPMLTEALLREVVERMGKDFNDDPSYLEYPAERRLGLMVRAAKDLESEQLDYDSLLDGNPSPSLRDQEYMQHSTLWGHQYVAGGAGEGEQRLRPSGILPNRQLVKTDAVLPAYCNPPNPCPVGYTASKLVLTVSTRQLSQAIENYLLTRGQQAEDQSCIINFENTAAFSREYQLAQSCMCDGEHMFTCPEESRPGLSDDEERKRRDDVYKMKNPFLDGERLPIAAKKGFSVVY